MTNKQDTSVEWDKKLDEIRESILRNAEWGGDSACLRTADLLEEMEKIYKTISTKSHQQGYKEGYLAGGKAERERTKKLIDDIHEEFKRDVLKLANPALSLAAGIEIKINKYEKETKGDL